MIIKPLRFGLKYQDTPIPKLALEYEQEHKEKKLTVMDIPELVGDDQASVEMIVKRLTNEYPDELSDKHVSAHQITRLVQKMSKELREQKSNQEIQKREPAFMDKAHDDDVTEKEEVTTETSIDTPPAAPTSIRSDETSNATGNDVITGTGTPAGVETEDALEEEAEEIASEEDMEYFSDDASSDGSF